MIHGRNSVVMLGYSPGLAGGVTKVSEVLIDRIPFLELHPILHMYRPRLKATLCYLYSLALYLGSLPIFPPRAIHVIVGSSGDAVRVLPFIVAARMRGCKVCIQFHKSIGVIFSGLSTATKSVVVRGWGLAHAHCFLSESLRDEYEVLVDKSARSYVIPNALAEDWLAIRPLTREQRTQDLVFLGRWSNEKGVNDLVEVMQSLGTERPIVCDTYTNAPPNATFANCRFHAWVDEQRVREILSRATLLLLPSYAEAYPTVLLEAAACGTPFVATRIAGIPDIAAESGAGLLHEVGDIIGMRQAIVQLLTDDEQWRTCSRKGAVWASTLTPTRVVTQWLTVYEGLGVDTEVYRQSMD